MLPQTEEPSTCGYEFEQKDHDDDAEQEGDPAQEKAPIRSSCEEHVFPTFFFSIYLIFFFGGKRGLVGISKERQ